MLRIDSLGPLALYHPEPGTQAGAEVPGLEKETLVLGHALGANREMWTETIERLPSNLNVILWEQPGHGASQMLEDPDISVPVIADVLADSLSRVGVEKFHLAGLSLGGMVTIAFAQRHGERLKSAGVLDAGPVLEPREPWLQRARMVKAEGMEPLVSETMARWFTPQFLDAPEVERTARVFLETDPGGYAQCCEAIARTDLRGGLVEIDVRTLVLTGDQDAGLTPSQAGRLVEAIPTGLGPVIISPARHQTAIEHPREVAQALVDNIVGAS